MKALVIGGNRYFGLRLVGLLESGGHEVTVLNRGSKFAAPPSVRSRIERILCDRTDRGSLAKAVDGRRWNVVFDQVCFDARTAREACEIFSGKTERYVFTSSQAVSAALPCL